MTRESVGRTVAVKGEPVSSPSDHKIPEISHRSSIVADT